MNNSKQWGRVRREIIDAKTGKVVKSSGWTKNLVFDSGLNRMANNLGFAGVFEKCKVGSGTNPNAYASGGVTFTQVGTTITANGSFFTSAMNGALFKYGTGSSGAESYITFVDATHATSSVSATVASPTVATVWQVQQTGLQTYLFTNASYDSGAGNCTTIFSGGTATMLRTFIFAVQGSPYTVNEIGYSDNSTGGGTVWGRVVLSSSDVVSPSQFYRVQIQIVFNVAPFAPTAVLDVGTNIVTAGQVMCQVWDCDIVNNDGSSGHYQPANIWSGLMDLGNLNQRTFSLHTANDITLNSSILTSNAVLETDGSYTQSLATFTNSGQPVGVGISNTSFSFTTAGETLYSLVFGGYQGIHQAQMFVLLLTTPVVLPTGAFIGNLSFTVTFSRTLTN